MSDDYLYDTDGTPYFIADPSDIDGYGFDLATDDWLESGETVDSVVWTVPDGVTVDTGFPNYVVGEYNSGGIIKVALDLSATTVDTDYDITAHWVTSLGRERDRTFRIKVQER